MPKYKSKSNKTEVIYYDQKFLPGVETESKRYINLNRYPFLEKISETPYKNDILLLDNINAPAISSMQDFVKTIMLRITDENATDGDSVTVAFILGDTDNIKDFTIIKEKTFKRKKVTDTVSLWHAEDSTQEEWNWPLQFLFYYIAVTAISVTAPIKIYSRSII